MVRFSLTAHDQAGSDEEDESADEDYQPQKDEDWKKVCCTIIRKYSYYVT